MHAAALGQGPSFVHPSLAPLALGLAAVPLVIHLINRRRFRRVPWAAMGFLLAASRRSARRIRLEQFLLLALRTLAVLCIGLAVARPYLSSGGLVPAGESPIHRVMLVDNSLSMRFLDDKDVTRFVKAQAAAGALVESFPERDPVSVVTMAAPAKVVARGSHDRRQIREQLSGLQAAERGTDVTGALTSCLEILAEADVAPGNCEVYVISDMARRTWGVTEESTGSEATALANRLFSRGGVHVVQCDGGAVSNLALVRFAPQQRLAGRHQPLRLFAEVANFGRDPARGYQLHVLRGDRIVRRVDLPAIQPTATERVTFSVGAGEVGHQTLEARLHPPARDALGIDDRRLLAVRVADTLPILVVEGRRGAGRSDGDAGYLVTAMSPRVDAADTLLLEPKRITARELLDEALDDYEMAVLCNVDRLLPTAWTRIEQFVRRGGGLLITAGDAVSIQDYNTYGYRNGDGVLPAGLLEPFGEEGEPLGTVYLATPEDTNELMSDFADVPGSGLFRAGIRRHLSLDPETITGEVLAQFDNGAPAIVVRALGQGRAGLLTTSADMSWTNMPAKGDFVSLTQKLVGLLIRSPAAASNVLTGQAYQRALSPVEVMQPLRVVGPDGRTAAAAVERSDDRLLMVCRDLPAAGFYRVGPAGREECFAVNTDPAESDPACLDEAALTELLVGEFTYYDDPGMIKGAASGGAVSETASLLVHLGLLLLACETWAAMRFGANR